MFDPRAIHSEGSFAPAPIPSEVADRIEMVKFMAKFDNLFYQERLVWMAQNAAELLATPPDDRRSACALISAIFETLKSETCEALACGALPPNVLQLFETLEPVCDGLIEEFSKEELRSMLSRVFPTGMTIPTLTVALSKRYSAYSRHSKSLIDLCRSAHALTERPSPVARALFEVTASRLHELSGKQMRTFVNIIRGSYSKDEQNVEAFLHIVGPHLNDLPEKQFLVLSVNIVSSRIIPSKIRQHFADLHTSRGLPLPAMPPLDNTVEPAPFSGVRAPDLGSAIIRLSSPPTKSQIVKLSQQTAHLFLRTKSENIPLHAKEALLTARLTKDPIQTVTWGVCLAQSSPDSNPEIAADIPLYKELLQSLSFDHLYAVARAFLSLAGKKKEAPLRLLTAILFEKYDSTDRRTTVDLLKLLPFAETVDAAAHPQLESAFRKIASELGTKTQLSLITRFLLWSPGPSWARALALEALNSRLSKLDLIAYGKLAKKIGHACRVYPTIAGDIMGVMRANLAARDPQEALLYRSCLPIKYFGNPMLPGAHIVAAAPSVFLSSRPDKELLVGFLWELKQLSGQPLQEACNALTDTVDAVEFKTRLGITSLMYRLGFREHPALRPLYTVFENRCISSIVDDLATFTGAMPSLPDHAFALVVRIIATKGYRDLALCRDIARETIHRAPRLHPKIFATIADAFGNLRIEDREFWNCFADHARDNWEAYKADRFASSSLWALAAHAPHLVPKVCGPHNISGIETHASWLKVYQSLLLSRQLFPTSYPPRYEEMMKTYTPGDASRVEIEFGSNLPRALRVPPSNIRPRVPVCGFETDWVIDLQSRRLIIELDGDVHYLCGPDGKDLLNGRDIFQDKIFDLLGYEVFHFPSSALRNKVSAAQVMNDLNLVVSRINRSATPGGVRRVYLD